MSGRDVRVSAPAMEPPSTTNVVNGSLRIGLIESVGRQSPDG